MPVTTYLNQTASLKAKTGYDKFGKPTTSTGVTFECRLQASNKKMVKVGGEEFLIDAEMWVKPTQTIVLDDVVVFGSDNYKVIRVDTKRGFTGSVDHKKIYLLRTKE